MTLRRAGETMTDTKGLNRNKPQVLVTEPYIPSLEKYMRYVESAFTNKRLTNGGPLLAELTDRLKDYLDVKYLLLVNNGTSALQVAYQLKGLAGKTALTTPFTFPATSTALHWQNTNVKLADIDPLSWNLCPTSVQESLSKSKIHAVVPVNIFGTPCDMEAFDKIGQQFNVPIIYDSAQALLSQYKGKSIFNYGDIHCVSFHATKLFHTVEGGALTFKNKEDYELAHELINFGFNSEGVVHTPGINAKMSELHAAMGLCILDELPMLISDREKSVAAYKCELESYVTFQTTTYDSYTPPMYMPIGFKTEAELLQVNQALSSAGYQSRRYFYPNDHKFINGKTYSNHISSRVLCLPLMYGLTSKHIKCISEIVKRHIS